ncbi:MAG: tRNA (adenosine(37)-N6)-dimethylallyltransferase MiaA [Candidatus Rokuibacteriota bacterium]
MSMRSPLLVIAGSTGVGKTAAAVALARRLPIEVVSADSRQVYRGMDAATGKPTAPQRRAVAHHLIDVVEPDDRYTAARFRADAVEAIAAIRLRGALPVVVGGTGLYVRALLRGLDPMPPADPAFRSELAGVAASQGRAALHARLTREAPEMAGRLHPNDAVRVMRALELTRAGRDPAALARWRDAEPEWDVLYIGLTLPREALGRQLHERAAAMVAAGLPQEVEGLLARGCDPALPALHGIGYRQWVAVTEGRLTPAEALRQMQRDTVRYARRQRTWFQREPGIEWLDVDAEGGDEGVARIIERKVTMRGMAE